MLQRLAELNEFSFFISMFFAALLGMVLQQGYSSSVIEGHIAFTIIMPVR